MMLNVADVRVRVCSSAEEVRELATQTVRKAVKMRKPLPPRIVAIQDQTPEPTPVEVVHVAPVEDIHVENFAIPDEPAPQHYPSIAAIMAAVCKKYEVAKIDLISARRHMKIVLPRQIVMFLARTMTLHTLPAIGMQLGGRDHTTILHGVRKVTERRTVSPEFDSEVAELERALRK